MRRIVHIWVVEWIARSSVPDDESLPSLLLLLAQLSDGHGAPGNVHSTRVRHDKDLDLG